MRTAVLRIVAILSVLVATAHAGPQDELTVNVGACNAGKPRECVEAAAAMDKLHIENRMGQTARALRERAVVLFEQRCTEGDADLCFEHGRLLQKRGDARAKVQIERACTLKSAEGCQWLGNHTSDRKKSSAYFDQACEYGSAHACEQLATRDKARAPQLHRKACDGDDVLGCVRSAELERTAGDRAAAFTDFNRACELGEAPDRTSCDAAGVLAAEPAKARELFARACDADISSGCSHLADQVAHGQGGERDWGKSLELAHKGCTLAHDARCAHEVTLRAHPPDWHCSTRDACEKLCAEQVGLSCRALAELSDDADGAYRRGCEAGDATSCLYGGNLLPEADAAIYARGCKLGDAPSCVYADYARQDIAALRRRCGSNHVACTLYAALIEKTDDKTAAKLWRVECARKDGVACRYLAMQLHPWFGYGTCDCDMHTPTKSELAEQARAQKLYAESVQLLARGCDAGDERSCQHSDPPREAPKRPLTQPAWE